jgi:hypothetical protein
MMLNELLRLTLCHKDCIEAWSSPAFYCTGRPAVLRPAIDSLGIGAMSPPSSASGAGGGRTLSRPDALNRKSTGSTTCVGQQELDQAGRNPVTTAQVWSSCPGVLISLVNAFALQVMRSTAARACRILGGSADSQRRQASILIRRAAKDCLISGATVVDRPDSLRNWDTWKTGNPSCCSLACTTRSAFFASTSANELLR